MNAWSSKLTFSFSNSKLKSILYRKMLTLIRSYSDSSKIEMLDEIISCLSIESKHDNTFLSSPHDFIKTLTKIVPMISSETFMDLENAFYFTINYLSNLTSILESEYYTDFSNYKFISNTQKDEEKILFLFNSLKFSYCYVQGNLIFLENEEKNLSFPNLNENIFNFDLNDYEMKIQMFEHILFSLFYCVSISNLNGIEVFITKFFTLVNDIEEKNLNINNKNQNCLTFAIFANIKLFTISIFNCVCKIHALNDSSSIILLQYFYERGNSRDIEYKEYNINQLEDFIFNCKVQDITLKENIIFKIIEKYIIICLHYKEKNPNSKDKEVFYSVMSYIFSFLYIFQHFKFEKMKEREVGEYKEYNSKISFKFFVDFVKYSLFIYDFIIINKEKIQESPDDFKYLCLYSYIEYAGRVSKRNELCAVVSCFIIQEIIYNFNFTNNIAKAIFNFVCFLYHVQKLYPYENLYNHFFIFINDFICNNPDIVKEIWYFNDWNFLYISNYENLIKGFFIDKSIGLDIIRKNNDNLARHLISIVKKIKHVHIYELEVIFNYINLILDEPEKLNKLINDEMFMKEINKKIAYLIYNYDFVNIDSTDSNFINQLDLNTSLFNVINKLLIAQADEFFTLPKEKNLPAYLNYESFIDFINEKVQKLILKKSIVSYELLECKLIIKNEDELKACIFIYNLYKPKDVSKNDNYFSKFSISILHILDKMSSLSEVSKKKIKEILMTGLFNLQIAYFVILQSLYENPINFPEEKVTEFFLCLSTKEHKYHLYYFVSLLKFIDHIIWLLTEKVEYDIKQKNFNIYAYLKNGNGNPTTENRNKLTPLKNLIDNWKKVMTYLNNSVFLSVVKQLKEKNYPKTCINLVEKHVYDTMKENNISNIINYPDKELIRVYFDCLSNIDDNKQLLKSYFVNQSLYNELFMMTTSSYNFEDTDNVLSFFENFFLYPDLTKMIHKFSSLKPILSKAGLYHFNAYFSIFTVLIDLLYTSSLYRFNYKFNEIQVYIISEVAHYLNKYHNRNYGNNTFLITLYEISKMLNALKESVTIMKDINKVSVKLPNSFIHKELSDIVNNRKLPYLSKNLLQYKIRKTLCYLTQEKELEITCTRDIVKTLKHSNSNNNEQLLNYLTCYRKLLLSFDDLSKIDIKQIYTCFKYHYVFCNGEFREFEQLYQLYYKIYKNNCNIKFEIIYLKNKERLGLSRMEINKEIEPFIKSYCVPEINKHFPNENDDVFCAKADLFLYNFYTINQIGFDKIKTDNNIKNITIDQIDLPVFEYIRIAIVLCIHTTISKYITRYLPEIVNYLHKIQLAFINSANISNNTIIKKKIFFTEALTLMREVHVNKLPIVLPQLVISYSYPKTDLYSLSVDLIIKYASSNIDLVGFLLGSFLCSDPDDNKFFISSSRHSSILNKYAENIKLSKEFAEDVIKGLNDYHKRILVQYSTFQEKLKNFFLIMKNNESTSSNKRKIDTKPLIDEINQLFSKYSFKIILPNLDNISKYNPKVRDNIPEIVLLDLNDALDGGGGKKKKKKKKKQSKTNTIIDNETLYICEMDQKFEVLDSKERPLKISFKACLYHEDIKSALKVKTFSFLLKGDLQDISKELKTFELFNQINRLLHIKHYDSNYNMKLKRYLITPISSQIVLAEWLENTDTFQRILNFLLKRNSLDVTKFKNDSDSSLVKKGSIKNLPEKYNLLYEYIHFVNPDPNHWYNYITHYIISTAVWSITGFLVGLGDRHTGNIMMGRDGEVIHIDFGYVLGKGRALPYPEVVDFRFTLNIRRTLSLLEENGLFMYICKKTIEMFKEFYNTLKSILEYYAFDPFFSKENDKETYYILNKMNNFFQNEINNDNSILKIHQLILRNSSYEYLERMYIGWLPMI